MTYLLLLAQDTIAAPDWGLAALAGFAAGLVPHIVSLVKTRHEIRKSDHQMTAAERTQLLRDLRAEREEIKKDMRILQKEHSDCLQKSAAQQVQIEALQQDVKELKEATKNTLTTRAENGK